ncbi:MAG: dihydroneopterin aldolase [Actinomycetota bacterium]|nr:dihydroneopterin aldolase [Actinomycetota bacterium]
MSHVVVRLDGIRARGRHGASPGEPDRPQDFVVDLDVTVDVEGDHLDGTADYRELARTARDVIEGEPVVLLETLAARVAAAVAALERVVEVRATIHKPRAASSVEAEDVSATATAPAARPEADEPG